MAAGHGLAPARPARRRCQIIGWRFRLAVPGRFPCPNYELLPILLNNFSVPRRLSTLPRFVACGGCSCNGASWGIKMMTGPAYFG